jgi:cytochrome c-type biogenesis protein CcmH/NrfF
VIAMVIAHAGHWLPQLLYLAPLVVLIVAIGVGRMRERREAREGGEPPADDRQSD